MQIFKLDVKDSAVRIGDAFDLDKVEPLRPRESQRAAPAEMVVDPDESDEEEMPPLEEVGAAARANCRCT